MNANPIKTLIVSILVMMCLLCLSVSLWSCKDDPKAGIDLRCEI
jgi:hypothetical protein